jgi:ATP-dependent RNA helicase SUPV3L1/SUV3
MSAPTSRVRALLGPTNTGKTHRAITAMLAHRSGMIGLPLRLLAREVYDRVVRAVGEANVALVTGEEKRVPAHARYFVCTVEAMPVSRRVAFLAVDEIQLAGDRQRGHVFTDRLLNARGTFETWFLGADTIAGLVSQLVPEAEIETATRLSTLRYAGERKLTSLPPRTAVVAFSSDQVYEQAERLRAVHGGAAVVLGALSPRTRNAQVAMYQAGEVQHLVATDAIGMGLNMDVAHVAFSALRKFDGHRFRDLRPAEVGQIAGRAGRYKADGTFGATRALGPLPDEVVHAVEQHAFAPLTRLFWRNSRLDFGSPEALLASLAAPPPHPTLRPVRHEGDQLALQQLSASEALQGRLTTPQAVERLWDVCKVPDYRKSLTGAHVQLLEQIAVHRVDDRPIPAEWLAERLERLDRTEGDLDRLMARIAWIRTWTFVTHQRGWLEDPAPLQQQAMAIEDRLSDALHDRLTQRFVDRTLMYVVGGHEVSGDLQLEGDRVLLGSVQVGTLDDLSFVPAPDLFDKKVRSAVRRALSSEANRRVGLLEAAPDEAFTIDDEGRVCFDGVAWATLQPSDDLARPRLRGRPLDLLDPIARDRVRARLQAWLDGWVGALLAPLQRGPRGKLEAPGKGIVHQLEGSLGTVDRKELITVDQLEEADRKRLARLDVRIGTRTVYVQRTLRGDAMARKAVLWSVHHDRRPLVPPPPNGPTSVGNDAAPWGLLKVLGYRRLGPRWVRADILERLAAHARAWARSDEARALDPVLSWLGSTHDEATAALEALGYRLGEADDDGAHRLSKRKARRRGRGRRR